MNNAPIALLNELLTLNVKLSVVDGNLKIDAVKGVLTPDLISRIKENKASIIHHLNEVNMEDDKNYPPLHPIDRNQPLALSFTQQRFWFMEQLNPGNISNIPLTANLDGNLNIDLLEQSFIALIRANESLRTTYIVNGSAAFKGEPVQIINSVPKFRLSYYDLSQLTGKDQLSALNAQFQQTCLARFDLTIDLMLRKPTQAICCHSSYCFRRLVHEPPPQTSHRALHGFNTTTNAPKIGISAPIR
jgi:hypothetical protein